MLCSLFNQIKVHMVDYMDKKLLNKHVCSGVTKHQIILCNVEVTAWLNGMVSIATISVTSKGVQKYWFLSAHKWSICIT